MSFEDIVGRVPRNIYDLCDDVWTIILPYLYYDDIWRLKRTSKIFKSMINAGIYENIVAINVFTIGTITLLIEHDDETWICYHTQYPGYNIKYKYTINLHYGRIIFKSLCCYICYENYTDDIYLNKDMSVVNECKCCKHFDDVDITATFSESFIMKNILHNVKKIINCECKYTRRFYNMLCC